MESTPTSITVTWNQTGRADHYQVNVNDNITYYVNYTGVGNSLVLARIYNLPDAGESYCISVIAVSVDQASTPTTGCGFVTSKGYFVYILNIQLNKEPTSCRQLFSNGLSLTRVSDY